MDALVQPGTEPFWLALLVVVGLGIVEIISLLIGASASGLLDQGLGHHPSADGDGGVLGAWMSWLNSGGVPLLVLAVIFLSLFAICGMLIQSVATGLVGPLPATVAALVAVLPAIPLTRWSSQLVARIIPREETAAISQADFIGMLGEVTLGPLDQGKPGSVRVKDRFGNFHALRTRAAPGHTIPTGMKVLIVDGQNGEFEAIPAPPELS